MTAEATIAPSNARILFGGNISEELQSFAFGAQRFISPHFDGEGQPLTYLTGCYARGGRQYFRLHYKVLQATQRSQALAVYKQHVYVFDFLP